MQFSRINYNLYIEYVEYTTKVSKASEKPCKVEYFISVHHTVIYIFQKGVLPRPLIETAGMCVSNVGKRLSRVLLVFRFSKGSAMGQF